MPGIPWTKNQIHSLRRQHLEKGDWHLIHIRDRTPRAILAELQRLGISNTTKKKWTRDEKAQLRRLSDSKLSPMRIHQLGYFPDRSVNSIAKERTRLHLTNHEASRRISESTRLIESDRSEFERVALERANSRPTAWFSWQFGISRSAVKRRLEALGLSVSWKEACALPSSHFRRSQSSTRANFQMGDQKRRELRRDLILKRDEMRRQAKKSQKRLPKERICKVCDEAWFQSPVFFPLLKKVQDGKTIAIYHSRECRVCLSKRRSKEVPRDARTFHLQVARARLHGLLQNLHEFCPSLFEEGKRRPLSVKKLGVFRNTLLAWPADRWLETAHGYLDRFLSGDVTRFLDFLEDIHFARKPDLHLDTWLLDELIRGDEFSAAQLFQSPGKMSAIGEEFSRDLYRAFAMPAFALSLTGKG